MRLFHTPQQRVDVERWARRFTLCDEPEVQPADDEFHLRYLQGQLSLHKGSDAEGVRVETADADRRRRGKLALAQACGDAAGGTRSVFDATTGLGTDLLTLYFRGYQVHGMERHPVVLSLLESYLSAGGLRDITLQLGDAVSFLEASVPGSYDVVYLDPMFPETGKTALPGKRMQYLRELVDSEPGDTLALFEAARIAAGDRVVLKRRLRDPLLGRPDWQVKGRSVRYDVYRALT
jgi:16S rRNA (guanine1516-N2)-methyltransferase